MASYEARKFYENIDYIYYMSIKYAVFKLGKQWICAYRPELKADEKGVFFTSWSQGHYFTSFKKASEYIQDKLFEYVYGLAEEIIDEMEDMKEVKSKLAKLEGLEND